jgi:type VI secretion system protein
LTLRLTRGTLAACRTLTGISRERGGLVFEKRLLERILTGDDRTRIELDPSAVLQDVLDHLRELFNVRAGSVPTRPDYGMPDFNDVVHEFPDALATLRAAIQRQIVLFEPRLREVGVRHVPTPERPLGLVFSVTALLALPGREHRVTVETEVSEDGIIRLRG